MSYELYPIFFVFMTYFCLPLFLKNKKFFFKKNFFLFKKSVVNINILMLQMTYIHLLYIFIYLYVSIAWNTYTISNMYFLVFYFLIFVVYYILYSANKYISNSFVSWELSFSLCGTVIFLPFFFLKLSLFQYFFITEIIAAFLFFILYYKNIKNKAGIFNKKLSVNIVYFQLILNSLVSVTFTITLIYINLYTLMYYNNVLGCLLILILILKVGIGPAFFFKWYIFQSLSVLSSAFMSIIYLFIYFFFINFLYNHIMYSDVSYILSFIFLINSFVMLVFYNRVTVGSSFLQYSSALTYNLFLLFLPIF